MELACVWCNKPAYTVEDGDALCYDHYKSPHKPIRLKKYPKEIEELMKKYRQRMK